MINLDTANPLAAAVEDIDRRTPVGSVLSSAEWSKVPVDIRQRSFFSSGVESMKMLEAMKEQMTLALKRERTLQGEGVVPSKARFVVEMRALADRLGIRPNDERRGTIQDIGSYRRLELIWRINMKMAYGFAQHKSWHDPASLEAFPAAEFVRLEDRRVPRDWPQRWFDAMDDLGNPDGIILTDSNRMVARLDSPIWVAISRFGLPYAPFDFNSGMGMRRLRRRDAIALGVMTDDDVLTPIDLNFNSSLSQQAPKSDEFQERLKKISKETIVVRDEKAVLADDRSDPVFLKTSILNGETHPETYRKVAEGFAILDDVTGDGPLPYATTSIESVLGDGMSGTFYPGFKYGVPRPQLRILADDPEVRLTLWHEVFHWFDQFGLPKGKAKLATQSGEMNGLMSALRNSQAAAELFELGKSDPWIKGYMASDQEFAARAFSQFIAEQSGDELSRGIIAEYLKESEPRRKYHYWEKEDFKETSGQFRQLLKGLGWLRDPILRLLRLS